MGFAGWVQDFEAEAERRDKAGDPAWSGGARMHPDVVRSVQRFQVGEAGDGANLIAKAEHAGDAEYSIAVKLFVAEEQNHARMLALLLAAAGARTVRSHWSDTVFVRLRRALGLRLELLVLLVAEVIALRYYRALRDGTSDPLISDVAGRILRDEERHVPFHCQRLHDAFHRNRFGAGHFGRKIILAGWRFLLAGTALVVAIDHGKALRRLGVTRRAFLLDVLDIARPMDFC